MSSLHEILNNTINLLLAQNTTRVYSDDIKQSFITGSRLYPHGHIPWGSNYDDEIIFITSSDNTDIKCKYSDYRGLSMQERLARNKHQLTKPKLLEFLNNQEK